MLTKRKKQDIWLTQEQYDALQTLEDGVVYHITDAKVDYSTEVSNRPILKTDNTTAQSTSASETITGTINLHKVAKTGTYTDLLSKPTLGTAAAKDAGTQNGVADLDANGKVPANELPIAENGSDEGGTAGAVKLQGTHYAGLSVNITTKNMSIAETTDSDTFWNNRKIYGFAVKGNNIDKYLKLALGSTSAQSDNTTTWTETNKQNACDTLGAERKTLTGSSAPTTSTVGSVGQWYLDTTNNKTYQCMAITSDGATPPTYTYTWEEAAKKNYVDTNFSKLDASNLSSANITSWANTCGFERVETVYDMSSNDASINWGFTSGIPSETTNTAIGTHDVSAYKRLRFYAYIDAGSPQNCDHILELDLTKMTSSSSYRNNDVVSLVYSGGAMVFRDMTVSVGSNKDTFYWFSHVKFNNQDNNNSNAILYKIEGVY